MKQQKRSPYLQAAEWAAGNGYKWWCHNDGACVLLALADGVQEINGGVMFQESKAVAKFTEMFRPKGRTRGFWLADKDSPEESQNRRVLALLFAHQMSLTGDL